MHCPISHIALCDLRLPVTFSHGKHSVIFDAEYLTHWLRSCKLIDPITNEPVAADNALKLLRPVFLPHLNDTDMQRIEVFLKRAGWLDGVGGHVVQWSDYPVIVGAMVLLFPLCTLYCVFWISSSIFLEDTLQLFQSPSWELAASIFFFISPITFAAGCYLWAYFRFLLHLFEKWTKTLFYAALYGAGVCALCIILIHIPNPIKWKQICSSANEYTNKPEYEKTMRLFLNRYIVGSINFYAHKTHNLCEYLAQRKQMK